MNERESPAETGSIERYTGSFLVRVWREPSHEGAGLGPIRCFVRDLRSGREEHLGEPSELLPRLVAVIDEPAAAEAPSGDRRRTTPLEAAH
ncbi:MAG: hypothetical protein PVG07_00290 [Acidobacteriota bacterium]|jgi:hypothetical protein